MSKPLVKICGLTKAFQARAALALGADAVGLVFVKESSRYVSAEQAAAIGRCVRNGKSAVGVFADHPLEQVVELVNRLSLNAVQLHGRETPDYCRRLRNSLKNVKVGPWPFLVKSFAVRGPEVFQEVDGYVSRVDGVLLDTYHPQSAGGTGKRFNWELAAEFKRHWPDKPLVVAGGLNGENVSDLILQVNPWGVDVSSGVENKPGDKCLEKIAAFLHRVRETGTVRRG